ncbi:hypothetical protein GCM10011352_30080 [Marinobacterium zhoushanense]|uniref:Uncharacterized protein n=1 Tax=Marinobacterium zhoushanense TaxID=1679163 RepID=A0ABQ1KMU1_9GAMM|nr:hypothetical protein GCM10011352_30080 [Marinobacterium zhoushanense]
MRYQLEGSSVAPVRGGSAIGQYGDDAGAWRGDKIPQDAGAGNAKGHFSRAASGLGRKGQVDLPDTPASPFSCTRATEEYLTGFSALLLPGPRIYLTMNTDNFECEATWLPWEPNR